MTEHAARISGEVGGLGEFVVKSRSIEGIAWVVEVLGGRRVRCPCVGFQTRRTCRHAEAARAAWDAEPRSSLEVQLGESLEQARAARRARMAETEALLRN